MAEEQSHSWASPEIRDLLRTILALESLDEAERFFRDLCTLAELEAMGHRWHVAKLVDEGLPVPRGVPADGRLDDDGDEGGPLAAPRGGAATVWRSTGREAGRTTEDRDPGQGPAARAGGRPARGRRARARGSRRACPRVPVSQRTGRRAARPGGGHSRVRSGRRRRLWRSRALISFGSAARTSASSCASASAAARSRRQCRRSRAATELAISTGLRIATVFPRLAGEVLAEHRVEAELVDVTGSVEVAPRLGLADAIVDLVSSGNTLRTNGLRSLGALFSSEAVLDRRAPSRR